MARYKLLAQNASSGKLESSESLVFNVKDFGAFSDGTNASATLSAISSAISAANVAGGQSVYLPAGTYLVNGTVSVPGGVTLYGDGEYKTIIYSTTDAIIVDLYAGSSIPSTTFVGPRLMNLQVKGSKSAGTSQIGVKADDATYMAFTHVENVLITNTGSHGLYAKRTFSSKFVNIYSTDNTGYPFYFDVENMPGNHYESLYAGDVNSSAPAGFRIASGSVKLKTCNGINSSPSTSWWAIVGNLASGGIDGAASNKSAELILDGSNVESSKAGGILCYYGSSVSAYGGSGFGGDGNSYGVYKAVSYVGVPTALYPPFFPKGVLDERTVFANSYVDEDIPGTVSINGTTTVTGSSTTFTTKLVVGGLIRISNQVRKIATITNNTSLTVTSAFTSTASGQTLQRIYYAEGYAIHADDLPPLGVVGEGPKITQGEFQNVYYNTTNSRAEALYCFGDKGRWEYVTGTSTYANPGVKYYQVNAGSNMTLTLPWTGWYQNPEPITIKNISTTSVVITIQVASGGTIGGSSSYTLSTQYQSVTILPDPVSLDYRIESAYSPIAGITGSLTSSRVTIGSGTNTVTDSANLTFNAGSSILQINGSSNPHLYISDPTNTIDIRVGTLSGAPDRGIIGTMTSDPFVLYSNGNAGWGLDTSSHFLPYGTTNTLNIGSSSAKVADGHFGGSLIFYERTAPSTPSGNSIALYAKDVSGTSGLFIKNDAGTETQLGSGGSGDMVLASVQTVTGAKTFGTIGGAVGKLILAGSTSGSTILDASAVASGTVNLPAGGGTLASLSLNQTFTGVNTLTPTARSSGTASYFTLTTPADTGITAATESIGLNLTAATRTWADGTTTLQRERVFGAPTYNKTTTAATFTTAVNVDIADPIAGTGVTFTNNYSLRAANVLFTGLIKAGSAPTTLTDSAGKILSAALNTVAVAQGGTGASSASITAFNNITGLSAAGTTGTTSTNLVFSTSPSLTTPTLGVASATSLSTSAATPLILTNGQAVNIAVTSQTTGATTLTIPNFASVSDTFVFTTLAQTLSNKTFVAPALGTPASGVATNLTGTASGLTAGNVTTNANMTGDVTSVGNATTIGSNKVTLGMLATLAANSVIGNSTGSTATPTAVSMLTTASASSVSLRDSNANLSANSFLTGFQTTATAAGTTTLTVSSKEIQEFTGSTTQTVTLPVTSTLVTGQSFTIINKSSGTVTVNSSGGNLVQSLAANSSARIVCVLTSGTTAASWDAIFTGGGGAETLSVTDLTTYNGVSGNGTTAIAATMSSIQTNDILQWNGSNWINAFNAPSWGDLSSATVGALSISNTTFGTTISQSTGLWNISWSGNTTTSSLFKLNSTNTSATGYILDVIADSTSSQLKPMRLQARQNTIFDTDNAGNITLSPRTQTSGATTILTLTGAAHSGYTTGTEIVDVNFNLARTISRAAGAVSIDRAVRFQGRTLAFASSSTVTDAINVDVETITAGSNATITRSTGLRIKASAAAHHCLWADGATAHTGDVVAIGLSGGKIVRFVGTGGTGTINSVFNDNGALSSSATDGFVYIPRIDSSTNPSGTPTSYNGSSALVFKSDTTNGRYQAWGYMNSAWRKFGDSVKDEKVWLPAAGANNATAGSMWDLPTSGAAVPAVVTGTNIQKGVLDFADSGAFSAQTTLYVPSDFTGTVDANIIWTTSATTGNCKWSLATAFTACDATVTDDPSFNTASTVTTAAPGTANRVQTSSITSVTITGSGASKLMHIKISRDGTDGSDTIAATARLIGVEITFRRNI